jgi:Fe2+ or Zn2+ uptake regulation protein
MDVKTADVGLLQSRYRLTKQRAAVLRALGDGGHLSAEAILQRVRSEIPGVSLGTIYRTLDILRDIGLVQMFTHDSDAARFEASLDKHHHLLCSHCRTLVNVRANELAEIALQLARSERFDEIDFSLTIVGRCPSCAGGIAERDRYGDPGPDSTAAGRSSISAGTSA